MALKNLKITIDDLLFSKRMHDRIGVENMTRNIGLPVNEPKEKPLKNEKNNPFNGSITIRGKLF